MDKTKLKEFLEYFSYLKGDEKGEAQVFCDKLFQLYGHKSIVQAGGHQETRIKFDLTTKFADLVWGDRVIIEMKSRSEKKLEKHRKQVKDYWWNLRPNPPKYSLLCNFDEIRIYNFMVQDEPLDIVKVLDLKERHGTLNFLYPKAKKTIFENNVEQATRETASVVAKLFNSLTSKKRNEVIEKDIARKFLLQCVFSMFAEDYEILPEAIFTTLVQECQFNEDVNSYDLIGGLFRQMANPQKASGGRFKNIEYFNGGLFDIIEPIDLTREELFYLNEAALKDWSKVSPVIFGTIFENSLEKDDQHAFGAHFTNELDIYKIVKPTILDYFQSKLQSCDTYSGYKELLKEIRNVKILDPACGSGNFLYVAFRELRRLETEILAKLHLDFPKSAKKHGKVARVKATQFYGYDIKPFAVELAKLTLLLANEISKRDCENWIDTGEVEFDFEIENTIPLTNLKDNIICYDALFLKWEEADFIIGNPPFLGGRDFRKRRGDEYAEKIYERFPNADGQVDYCTHWFRLSHDNKAIRCGLVGTESISQNINRTASLKYIDQNDGYFTDVIRTQKWSGEAVVNVSIVNWVKDKKQIPKNLIINGEIVSQINTSLKDEVDVTVAMRLPLNLKQSFQSCELSGQGFVISKELAKKWIVESNRNKEVLKPMLDGSTLVNPNAKYSWVIDFNNFSIEKASQYKLPFEHVRKHVYPERSTNNEPKRRNKWWQFGRERPKMRKALENKKGYYCLSKVAKYTFFRFIPIEVLPCEANMVVTFDDFYIGGLLNSCVHQFWVDAQKSSMRNDPRYTNTTCYETFPFPLNIGENQKEKIREIMADLENFRVDYCIKNNISMTELYNRFYFEPESKLYKKHKKLDKEVVKLYGFRYRKDKSYNEELLELNYTIVEALLLNKGYSVSKSNNPIIVHGKDKKYFKKFGKDKIILSDEPQEISIESISNEKRNEIESIMKNIEL